MSKLEEQIECMRVRLHELVISKAGNMIDEEVSELSIKLDQLIVDYQKQQDKSTRQGTIIGTPPTA